MLTCGPCRFLVADSNLSDLFREALLSSSSDPPLVPGESEGFMRMEFWRGTADIITPRLPDADFQAQDLRP